LRVATEKDDNEGTVMDRRQFVSTASALAGSLTLWPSVDAEARAMRTSIVETESGKVRGAFGNGVHVFKGIPYGASTTGKNRFMPPVKSAPWPGARDCMTLGHQAPQMQPSMPSGAAGAAMNTPFVHALLAATKQGMETGNEGEDCLVLNVYTPDASRARKRPVMLWMHGGGFAIGSAGDPQYDGAPLARRGDVVVVTVNHRLNALGYLYLGAFHDDFADSGNAGQLDLVFALQWVRDNIEAFGGNPGNVTIFGESGGGAKVSTTLAMPPAHGLFHKAVIQSGASLDMMAKDKAVAFAERTLAALNIKPADVHVLQTVDYRSILDAAGAGGGFMSLSPVVDGRSLPRNPFDPDAPEISRDIPIMVGTCKDENTLFMALDPAFPHGTEDQVHERFTQMLHDKGDAAFALYKSLHPNDPPAYWLTSMATDMGMRMNSIRLAERKAAQGGAPVFMYRVDFAPAFLDGTLRTPHGTDVPLVFNTVAARPLEFGNDPKAERLAATMSQAWINFARNGDPSQRDLAWPQYSAQSRETMIFDVESVAVSDPDGQARQFWGA
jgi:para-nitrobenzyl esterase